jgi:hypothetical protein
MAREIRLLGFNLTKIFAEKKPDFKGQISVNNNISILSLEKHKLELTKEDALKINFNFGVSYGDLGEVTLSGTLFLLVDSKIFKEAIKLWEEKKIPEELRLFVLNLVMQKASLRALEIEEDLGFPPHIPLPRLGAEKTKDNKA